MIKAPGKKNPRGSAPQTASSSSGISRKGARLPIGKIRGGIALRKQKKINGRREITTRSIVSRIYIPSPASLFLLLCSFLFNKTIFLPLSLAAPSRTDLRDTNRVVIELIAIIATVRCIGTRIHRVLHRESSKGQGKGRALMKRESHIADSIRATNTRDTRLGQIASSD